MNVPQLPIWSAYVVAPALILVASYRVMMDSESPLLTGALAIVSGIVCACAVHGYVALKRQFLKQFDK